MVYLLAVAIQVAPTRPAVPNQRLQESLDPALLALRQQWEQLLRQDVQHLSNEEATWRHGIGSKTSGKQWRKTDCLKKTAPSNLLIDHHFP